MAQGAGHGSHAFLLKSIREPIANGYYFHICSMGFVLGVFYLLYAVYRGQACLRV